jgi:hypothetical protein
LRVLQVTGQGSGLNLVAVSQFAGHALGLVTAAGIDHGEVHALARQGMAYALPQAAIAAGDQSHLTPEFHA